MAAIFLDGPTLEQSREVGFIVIGGYAAGHRHTSLGCKYGCRLTGASSRGSENVVPSMDTPLEQDGERGAMHRRPTGGVASVDERGGGGLLARTVCVVSSDPAASPHVVGVLRALGFATDVIGMRPSWNEEQRLAHVPLVVLDIPTGAWCRIVQSVRSQNAGGVIIAVASSRQDSSVPDQARQAGIAAVVPSPLQQVELKACLDSLQALSDELTRVAESLVGATTLSEAQRLLREIMYRRALELAAGNRSAVARMLSVSRTAVLKALDRARQ